jgi:hypothetical protein
MEVNGKMRLMTIEIIGPLLLIKLQLEGRSSQLRTDELSRAMGAPFEGRAEEYPRAPESAMRKSDMKNCISSFLRDVMFCNMVQQEKITPMVLG